MVDHDRSLKILCVDADAGRQEAFHRAIAGVPGRELSILIAESGGQGLSLAQTFQPHCLVVADALPDMGCADFVVRLARPEGAPAPAVVIAAAPGAEGAALAAMQAGADDFVQAATISGPTLQRALGTALEITRLRAELMQAKQHIAASGLDDPLTTLAGRGLFQDRLTHAVILGKRSNQNVAVMLIELTGLKDINFLKGHEAGDAALREVGLRLKATLRQADTVARTSGNQFGVVLHTGATHEGSVITAKKILAAMEEPVRLEDGAMELGLDIGIALFPNHGEDGDTLLHHAESAMGQARRAGGGYAVFAYDDMLVDFLEDGASVA